MARLSWAVRLERAEKRGKFLAKDYELASSFLTCAVGEKTHGKFHVINDIYKPAYRLGMEFYAKVKDQDIPEAKRIYQLIQELP